MHLFSTRAGGPDSVPSHPYRLAAVTPLAAFLLLAVAASATAFAAAPNATVVEYYRADVDRYFITASPYEQAILDEGLQRGWARTGRSFLAWADVARASPTARAVCRYLGRPQAGLDSHFYSAFGFECDEVLRRFPDAWQLESNSVFHVDVPATGGACVEGSEPVYRLFNNRSDANHRYVTSRADREAMIAQGWIAEGLGSDGVGMCAPRPVGSESDQPLTDGAIYSALAAGSLASASDAAAVSHHSTALPRATVPYTATTGHLVARDPASGQPQASMFYVAYSAQGRDAATRPITFFFNGGPGSATIWLHLGSFGPKRVATGGPSLTLARPYALVHNDESLIDATDMVFVDAVGTGLSQAIAPYANRSFWSVGQDAAVFRNFILRYLEVNGRTASPTFLFGESYGTVRAAVVANLLETAGLALSGVVLLASVMDYHTNCSTLPQSISCVGHLPTYAVVGDYHGRATRGTQGALPFIDEVRQFAGGTYAPAVSRYLASSAPPDASVLEALERYTGIGRQTWQTRFNLEPGYFQRNLLAGALLGRYDARVAVPAGSPLAAEGDPSSTLIGPSFIVAIQGHLPQTLRYSPASSYVSFGSAINSWDFSHDGREVPDAIPDLAAAIAQNPRLFVLSLNGYHDLATPFHQTERDLSRLGAGDIVIRSYNGGHMIYLDDASRRALRTDLEAMYRRHLLPAAASAQEARP